VGRIRDWLHSALRAAGLPGRGGASHPAAERRRRVGKVGERAAARYLRSQGLEIVARNVREGRGEIDIVARQGSSLVFVEVKSWTRGGREEVTGLEKVGPDKLRALRRSSVSFLRKYRHAVEACRIDAVTVEFEAGGWRRRIRELAWYPGVATLERD